VKDLTNLSKEPNEITRHFEKIWDDAHDPVKVARKRLEKTIGSIKEDNNFHLS